MVGRGDSVRGSGGYCCVRLVYGEHGLEARRRLPGHNQRCGAVRSRGDRGSRWIGSASFCGGDRRRPESARALGRPSRSTRALIRHGRFPAVRRSPRLGPAQRPAAGAAIEPEAPQGAGSVLGGRALLMPLHKRFLKTLAKEPERQGTVGCQRLAAVRHRPRPPDRIEDPPGERHTRVGRRNARSRCQKRLRLAAAILRPEAPEPIHPLDSFGVIACHPTPLTQ